MLKKCTMFLSQVGALKGKTDTNTMSLPASGSAEGDQGFLFTVRHDWCRVTMQVICRTRRITTNL